MSCSEHPIYGPCVRHVTVHDRTFHVHERLTFDPLGKAHATYANSKWVRLVPA